MLLFVPAAEAARPIATREDVTNAWNAFNAQSKLWAEAMNADLTPNTLPYDAVVLYDPMPKMFRKFEKAWRNWLMK